MFNTSQMDGWVGGREWIDGAMCLAMDGARWVYGMGVIMCFSGLNPPK